MAQEKKANQSLCQELAAERENVTRAEEKLVQGTGMEAALRVQLAHAGVHACMHQPIMLITDTRTYAHMLKCLCLYSQCLPYSFFATFV